MRIAATIGLATALSCVACAPTESVTISRDPPASSCRSLGPIEAVDRRPGSAASAGNAAEHLKAIAVGRGGDYVAIDVAQSPTSESRAFPPSYRLSGRLFRCRP